MRRVAQAGVMVATRAQCGFTAAPGTTDDPRIRLVTQHLPPEHAAAVVGAYTSGAGEPALRQAVERGLGHAYFRDGGRRAQDLEVELRDIDYLDIDL